VIRRALLVAFGASLVVACGLAPGVDIPSAGGDRDGTPGMGTGTGTTGGGLPTFGEDTDPEGMGGAGPCPEPLGGAGGELVLGEDGCAVYVR
jgi:hypothetical protein